jgi:hypothetical protein
MGRRARAMLDERYARQRAMDHWHTLLEKVTASQAARQPVLVGSVTQKEIY